MEQAFVIRAITEKDLDWLCGIAPKIGVGFTSLPNDKKFLKNRLQTVAKSFKEEIRIEERVYLFVRENLPQREIVGICGIDVDVGYKESFYSYQISTVSQACASLDKYIEHKLLRLVNNFQKASELISFWVHPDHRRHAVGTSLSFSRFLFMAQHKELIHAVENPGATGARKILEQQGFQYNQHVDIFDAGPVLYCERDKIHAVANSKLVTITQLDSVASIQPALLYNARMNARFTVAHIDVVENEAVITPEIAKILDVRIGDMIRYYIM